MPARPQRLALAFIAACCATLAAYALLRVGQRVAYSEANPAEVIYSEHAAYFWRAWMAAYLGAMGGAAAWLVAGRHEARLVRALPAAVTVAAAMITAQALLLP